jgi:hypothetical protein
MTAIRGRVVRTPTEAKPYKVVLEHEDGSETEHEVASVREGEALIKRETPQPEKRSELHDHPAQEALGTGGQPGERDLG